MAPLPEPPRGATPCPPWAYGVRVVPGPSWDDSGFGPQDFVLADGSLPVCGTTRVPDDTVLNDWAQYLVDAANAGAEPAGGWAPHRSSCVQWGDCAEGTDRQYYYKSADNGLYDLYYFPGEQDTREFARDGLRTTTWLFRRWKSMVHAATIERIISLTGSGGRALRARVLHALQAEEDELLDLLSQFGLFEA